MPLYGQPTATAAPTPLSAPQLAELTQHIAGEVRRGLHDVHFNAVHRWSARVRSHPYRDYCDVWLISWTREQGTSLHDHAGSLGALTVVEGTLTERYWDTGLAERDLAAGTVAAFPLGHVHDVLNTGEGSAVSVHAYSPPLTAISFYRVDPSGGLRRTHSVLTGHPEPDAPAPGAAVGAQR